MFNSNRPSIYDSNLGVTDRVLRTVASAAMIGAFMAFQTAGSEIYCLMALIALPVAATALLGWDPLYALLGISSTGEKVAPIFAEFNVGRVDSYVRYGISAALVAGFMVLAPTPIGWTGLLPLLAIPVFATALVGWCPVYTLLQLNTRPSRARAEVHYSEFYDEYRRSKAGHGRKAA